MDEPRPRRRDLRETFDAAADRYHTARPDYPDALFDDLVALAGIAPDDRLLEVGCGTGKATAALARRGFRVVAVELGGRLAAEARRRLAGLPAEVHHAAFETWEPPGDERFALVYAATAWHWLDPEVRYERAHRLLRPEGHLAIWSAGHAFPAGFDPFFAEIQPVYEEIGEARPDPWPPLPPDAVPDSCAEIEASGRFAAVQVRRYLWERTYDADEYLALLDTFSDHLAMEAAARAHLHGEIRRLLAQRPDGRLLRHWAAILHVARRVG